MIFPLGSTTNKPFNINFDNIISSKDNTAEKSKAQGNYNLNSLYNFGTIASPTNQTFIEQINNFQNRLLFEPNNVLCQYYGLNPQINQNNYFNFNYNSQLNLNNDILLNESNDSSPISLQEKKNLMPNIDIDAIKKSDTGNIFNECLMNSYNLYSNDNQKKVDVIINSEIPYDYSEYTNVHNDLNVNNQMYNLSSSPSSSPKKN